MVSVDMNVVNNWLKTVWTTINQEFDENYIIVEAIRLFFKLTPDKTIRLRGEKYVGAMLSKERITVLVCANTTGTEKGKLLIIGKNAIQDVLKG